MSVVMELTESNEDVHTVHGSARPCTTSSFNEFDYNDNDYNDIMGGAKVQWSAAGKSRPGLRLHFKVLDRSRVTLAFCWRHLCSRNVTFNLNAVHSSNCSCSISSSLEHNFFKNPVFPQQS